MMRMRGVMAALGLGVALLPQLHQAVAAPPQVAAAEPGSAERQQAEAVVARFHDELIDALKTTKGEGFQARFDAMAPAIERAFNLPSMAETSVGSYWARMSDAQQAHFVDVFSRLSVATYANRFDDYTGQSFEPLGAQPGPRDSILVRTRLVIPGEDPVNLNYVVRNIGDSGWRITDVFLDGSISELAVRRSEYTSVIRSQGVDALIDVLEKKIAQLARGS